MPLAGALRDVEGDIGAPQHLHRLVALVDPGDTTACVQHDRSPGDLDGFFDPTDDPLGDAFDLLDGDVVVEHDCELVAAKTRDEIFGAERLLDPTADLRQCLVAGRMTEPVVDGLEAVEVEHETGAVLAHPAGRGGAARLARFGRPVSASWKAWCSKECNATSSRSAMPLNDWPTAWNSRSPSTVIPASQIVNAELGHPGGQLSERTERGREEPADEQQVAAQDHQPHDDAGDHEPIDPRGRSLDGGTDLVTADVVQLSARWADCAVELDEPLRPHQGLPRCARARTSGVQQRDPRTTNVRRSVRAAAPPARRIPGSGQVAGYRPRERLQLFLSVEDRPRSDQV